VRSATIAAECASTGSVLRAGDGARTCTDLMLRSAAAAAAAAVAEHRTLLTNPRSAARRRPQRSNGQVLTELRRGTSSHQLSSLPTTSGRTVCRKTSQARSEEC